jgi:hypothetical protein
VKKKKKKDSEEALSHPAPGKAATRGPHLPLPLSQFFNRSQSKPPHKLITAIQNVNQDFFRISNTTKHRAAQNTRVDFPSIKDQGKTKQKKNTKK